MTEIRQHDVLIAQMAATLLAGEMSGNDGELILGSSPNAQDLRNRRATSAVMQARAIFQATMQMSTVASK